MYRTKDKLSEDFSNNRARTIDVVVNFTCNNTTYSRITCTTDTLLYDGEAVYDPSGVNFTFFADVDFGDRWQPVTEEFLAWVDYYMEKVG